MQKHVLGTQDFAEFRRSLIEDGQVQHA
jgi:hypothetical protein